MERIEVDMKTGEATVVQLTAEEVAAALADAANAPLPVIVVSPWQIRKALNQMGLREAVEAAVSASTDQALKDGWEYATEFRSDDPFVLQMGVALGQSDVQTHELIALAATL